MLRVTGGPVVGAANDSPDQEDVIHRIARDHHFEIRRLVRFDAVQRRWSFWTGPVTTTRVAPTSSVCGKTRLRWRSGGSDGSSVLQVLINKLRARQPHLERHLVRRGRSSKRLSGCDLVTGTRSVMHKQTGCRCRPNMDIARLLSAWSGPQLAAPRTDFFAEELVLVTITPQWPSGSRFGFEVHGSIRQERRSLIRLLSTKFAL